MWWIYALLSALFAALTALFAKLGVSRIPPDLATAIRTVVVLILTWGIVYAKGEWRSIGSLNRQGLFFLLLSGLATGTSWLFYFKALKLGKVSQVAPLDRLSVALTIVLAALFLGEKLAWKTALGALLIIGGTLVLVL